jgi:hypothetical protein
VIDTIQQILFPLDSESEPILRSLISKQGLDPDCQRRDASVYRRASEKDIQYHYFGCRMIELMDEIENPAPRGAFGKWLQRKSGNSRYSIEIALYGLMFALVLGTLGLGLAIFQAWVAYQAWKEPVE